MRDPKIKWIRDMKIESVYNFGGHLNVEPELYSQTKLPIKKTGPGIHLTSRFQANSKLLMYTQHSLLL